MAEQSKTTSNQRPKPTPAVNAVSAPSPEKEEPRNDPAEIRHLFESGEYPYKDRIPNSLYNKHMLELQRELLKAQLWVQETGQHIVILFEGYGIHTIYLRR